MIGLAGRLRGGEGERPLVSTAALSSAAMRIRGGRLDVRARQCVRLSAFWEWGGVDRVGPRRGAGWLRVLLRSSPSGRRGAAAWVISRRSPARSRLPQRPHPSRPTRPQPPTRRQSLNWDTTPVIPCLRSLTTETSGLPVDARRTLTARPMLGTLLSRSVETRFPKNEAYYSACRGLVGMGQ